MDPDRHRQLKAAARRMSKELLPDVPPEDLVDHPARLSVRALTRHCVFYMLDDPTAFERILGRVRAERAEPRDLDAAE
jgi:hypothetical protein